MELLRQAKLKVTGISVALRILLTDKVHSIKTWEMFHRVPQSHTCFQRDIRLERNDIIAMVNTLQQVPRKACSFTKTMSSAATF
jgi:hypothetical protein